MAPTSSSIDSITRLVARRREVGLRWRVSTLVGTAAFAGGLIGWASAGFGLWPFLITLVVVAGIAGAGHYLSLRAVRPSEILAERIRDIARGDAGLGARMEVGEYEDVASAAKDFNSLLERLEGLISPLADRSKPLVEAAKTLEMFLSQIASRLASVDEIANGVTSATRESSNDLAGVSGSLQDVSACIGMLSTSADDISKSLARVADSCREEVAAAAQATDETALASTTV